MPIYIVCIGNLTKSIEHIGAVYLDEEEARTEVYKLNKANSFTSAYYVIRYAKESKK